MIRSEQLSPEVLQGYTPFAQGYIEGMYIQYQDPQHFAPNIGENILPSALLSAEQRRDHFKVDSYRDLRGDERLIERAQELHLVVHTLDAGLGTSVKRDRYLAQMGPLVGRGESPTIGSKATDLYESVPMAASEVFANVAEMRLTREIEHAAQFRHVTIRPVVNEESAAPVAALLNQQTLRSRMGMEDSMTYEDRIAVAGNVDRGDVVMQESLPTIDVATGVVTKNKRAPGGHGQAAAQILYEIAAGTDTKEHVIREITNGDGYTNGISPEMAAIAADRAAFTMILTTALSCDVKGGKGSVKVHDDGTMTPYILEVGQTKLTGQQDIFYKMGQEGQDLPEALAERHQPGEQYFNTNTVIMAEEPIRQFLQAVQTEMGEEFFKYYVAPEFFPNKKGDIYQFDGAMGSLILRMNELMQTTPQLTDIWNRVGGGRDFVRFINVEPEFRDEYFGPIKFPIDKVEKASNHFGFDTEHLCYINLRPGHVVHWKGDFVEKDVFLADVANVQDAFGHDANIVKLDEFEVTGSVLFANADHGGRQKIVSEYDGVVDLNAPEWRQKLGQPDGRLCLANLAIYIDTFGEITLERMNLFIARV